MKIYNLLSNIVELVLDGEDINEAMAALSLNRTIKWVKFTLTDDSANANSQRIPKEEFANLIKTGLYMPIKMARGYIHEGHEFSVPIGVITNLIEREHTVEGIAALWSKEFPGEIQMLQEMATAGDKPQISWEIQYIDSSTENDVESFKNVSLSAATIVGMPAYQGRTAIDVIAAKTADEPVIEPVTESVIEPVTEPVVEPVKEPVEVAEVIDEPIVEDTSAMDEKEFTELKGTLATLETDKATLTEAVTDLTEKLRVMTEERDTLKVFKDDVDAKAQKAEKIDLITKMFSEAGIDLPEDYFEDEVKASKLLSMTLEQLDFFMKDVAIFAKKPSDDVAGVKPPKHVGANLPNVVADDTHKLTPKEIVKALREASKKS